MSKIPTAQSATYRRLARLVAAVAVSLALGPAFSQSSNSPEAKRLFKDAFDLYQAREYGAASKLFQQALKVDDRDAMGWKYYGEALLQLDRRKEARAALRRAMGLLPVGKERAVIETRIEGITNSVLPGPECASVVREFDPKMLAELIGSIKSDDELVGGSFKRRVELSTGTTSQKTTFLRTVTIKACGDYYYIEDSLNESGARFTEVGILGLPIALKQMRSDSDYISRLDSAQVVRSSTGQAQQIETKYTNLRGGVAVFGLTRICNYSVENSAKLLNERLKGQAAYYQCSRTDTNGEVLNSLMLHFPVHGHYYEVNWTRGKEQGSSALVDFIPAESSAK